MSNEEEFNSFLNDQIFDGMLFVVDEDEGPSVRINASSLNDREAIATAIQGLTAVGLGEENIEGLFGPLPVPYNANYKALIYIFNVESTTSIDPEILEIGRFCALFIIFKKTMLRLIANVYSMIESLLNFYKETYLRKEEDLQIETLQLIYEDIIGKLKLKPRFRVFTITNGITVEYEEQKTTISPELTLAIDEKEKKIYYYISNRVDDDVKEKSLKILNYLNRSEYQDTLKKTKVSSKNKFIQLLEKHKMAIIN